MRCASCSLLLGALGDGGDGETYIRGSHSQAAVTYSNHASFRPPHIPRLARDVARLEPPDACLIATAGRRSAADGAVPTTGPAQESRPHYRVGTRRPRRPRLRPP